MNHLPTSILNLLGFTSGGRRQGKGRCGDEEEEDMTNMVKRLVMEQHRTMFYTVTISPQSQRKDIAQQNNIAPSLKWQCASSLSKSRMLLARTNSNSNKYYTFTYFETDNETRLDSGIFREDLQQQKSFSPVKIYNETRLDSGIFREDLQQQK